VGPRIQKARTVADGLQNDRWIRDISGALTVQVLLDYLLKSSSGTSPGTLPYALGSLIVFSGSGLVTKPFQRPWRIDLFSSGNILSRVQRFWQKHGLPANANSLVGWQSMIGVGQLPGGSDTASKMMTTALCAARILKPSHTFSSAAPSSGKFGSGYYGLLPGTA